MANKKKKQQAVDFAHQMARQRQSYIDTEYGATAYGGSQYSATKAQKQQANKDYAAWKERNAKRGTGSQTTSTGRATQPKQSDGLEVLRQAQAAMSGGAKQQTAPGQLPTIDPTHIMTPEERTELLLQTEERKQEQNKKQTKAARKALGDDEIATYIQNRDAAAREMKDLSLGDVLSNPLYAAGVALENLDYGVSDVARTLLNSKKQAEINRRVAEYNAAAPAAPGGASAGQMIADIVNRGAANWTSGTAQTINTFAGAPLRAAGWKDNPLQRFEEAMKANQDANQARYDMDFAEANGVQRKVGDIGTSTVEALPDMVLLAMTGPGKALAQGETALTRDGARLVGSEAARAGASAAAGAAATARQVAKNSLKNPMFWTSFSRVAGPSYNYAKQQGATDWEASVYATSNAVMNAQVEMSGGLQTLPWELQQGGRVALTYLKSMAQEGNEEVVQGMIERTLQNLAYGADNPVFSTSDPNAVINPRTAASEFGMGAAVSAVLGAPSSVAQGVENMSTREARAQEAEAAQRAARVADADAARARQNEAFGAPMQSGTADAEALAVLNRNAARRGEGGAQTAGAVQSTQQSTLSDPIARLIAGEAVGNKSLNQIRTNPEARARLENALGVQIPNSLTPSQFRAFVRYVAQYGAESNLSDESTTEGNLTAEPQTAPTQSETGQNVYDWTNRANGGSELGTASVYLMSRSIGGATDPAQMERFMLREGIPAESLQEAVDNGYIEFNGKQYVLTKRGEELITQMTREGVFSTQVDAPRKPSPAQPKTDAPGGDIGEEARTFSPEDHIDNRTDAYISKTSTKAFQHEHPELHNHFANIAQRIMEEAAISIDRGVTKVSKKNGGGTRAYYDKGLKAVIDRTGLSRNQVIRVCQDIINDQGSENYADAKRVEQALDDLMSGGGEYADADYKQKKGEITGGTQAGSFEEYLQENELALAEGMTVEQLREEWENGGAVPGLITEETPAAPAGAVAEAAQEVRANDAQTEPTALELKAALEEQIGRPLTMADLDGLSNQELADRIRPAMATAQTDTNGMPEGHGPMSPAFPYREASTQTHGSDTLYNEDEREIEGLRPEDSAHKVNTDAEVDRNVQERLEFDYDGEKADLFGNKLSWDDADTALAHKIMEAEIARARLTGDYSEVARLQRVWEAHGTKQGQALRQRGRFASTPASIVSEAARILDDIRDELPNGVDPAALLRDIENDANALDAARRTESEAEKSRLAISLIESLGSKRKTGGFAFGLVMPGRVMETTKWALRQAAKTDGGADYLLNVAESQLKSRASDYAPASPLEVIKTTRYMGMLSKIATIVRNLTGNTGFDFLETYSEDTGSQAADALMSFFTKRRSMPFDRSWFSGAKRSGATEGAIRAYIETALDADVSNARGKYETRAGGRTLKAARSPAARFFSNLEKWSGYTLTVPDEFAKGGTRAEHQRGLDALKARGLLEENALEGAADEAALQRTFQNKGRTAGIVLGVRQTLDDNLALTDKRGGRLGVGTMSIPFAEVPANLGEQFLNYSPFGAIKGAAQVANVIRKGKRATAEEQQAAARAFGRGATGVQLVALAAAAAAKGIIHFSGLSSGDDDKDREMLEQTEGVSGVQINKDALARALRGESTAWQEGDELKSIGHLQPLNGHLAVGSLLADDLKDHDSLTEEDLRHATLQAVLETYKELPAFQSVSNIFTNYQYSKADTVGGKMEEVGQRYLGDTLKGFVLPNALTGIANASDRGRARETYDSSASVAQNTWNAFKSGVPGLRQTLPQSLDNWGQPRQTTATPFQNFLNTNLRAGAVVPYKPNEVNQELYRLAETEDVKMPSRKAVKEVKNGDDSKKTLTNAEQRTYQQTAGQTSFGALQQLIRSQQYAQMNDTERAAALNHLMEYGNVKGEQAVGGTKETPDWAERGDASVVQNAGFYSILEAAKKQLDKDDREKTGPQMQAILDRGLSEEDTLGVFRHILTGSSESTMEKIESAPDPLYWARNYVNIQTARATLPEDDQDKNGKQMQAVLNSGASTEDAFAQFEIIAGEGSKTVGKMRKLYDADYPLDQIVGYYIATSEKVIWDDEKGDYRARRKAEKIQWLMDTYGYTQAQANYMYKVFQNG